MGDTLALDTPDLATAVATDSAMEATLVATTASVRPRPSPRLMLRLIPTTDTATLDLATAVATDSATDTAVATDTSDKKVSVLKSTKASRPAQSRKITIERLNWRYQCSQIPDCRIFLARKRGVTTTKLITLLIILLFM